ncbi:hypothetical protein BT96DRAFT_998354 [Gymnopus androsaceus JB14]|uniref:Uncharacterized protein n=1 Tax=Gymnopus androsaceus JB14 TaxID=1447944 RepID=A0A6A4HAK0_9AGAR|nr:hypothetical protein BT96DRAFT_998354 [Gymnopus androsaceus JB14]
MAERENLNAPNSMEQHTAVPQNATSGNQINEGLSPTFNPMGSGFTPQCQSQFLPTQNPQSHAYFAFPPPQPSSGNTNQGFQTQTQGYYPSSYAFGSIQHTAGSNPNFAAGFNPAATTGSATSPYSQMSMTGPAPGSTMHPSHPGVPVVTPWAFNQNLGTVLHARGHCPQCDAMLVHIGTAFIDNEASFQAANLERVDYYRRTTMGSNLAGEDIVSLYRRIGELNLQLDNGRQHYDRLEDDYDEAKRTVERLRGERENARTERNAFKSEADLLREEVSWLRICNQELENQVPTSQSTVRPGKRKRTDDGPSTVSAVASSQHEDAEMVNYSDIDSVDIVIGELEQSLTAPTPFTREPVDPEDLPDGGYRTYEGFVLYGSDAADARRNTAMKVPLAHGGGIRTIKKPGDFTTVLEVIAMFRILRTYEDAGSEPGREPWKIYKLCSKFLQMAINTPENERNDLHRTVISNFFRPRFVNDTQPKKVDKGKGRAVLPDLEPELPPHDVTGSLPTAPTGAKSKKKNKSSAPSTQASSSGVTTTHARERMKNPTLSDSPEYWAQYYYEHPNNSVGGIRRDSEDHISVRSLRGRLLVSRRAPRSHNGAPAIERTRFLLISTELFATPGLYESLTASSTVASEVTTSRYPDTETRNTTLGSVVVFYASQGITVAMAEDAAIFAIEWLTGFRSTDSLLTNEAHAVQDRVVPVVSTGTVPAGFDENAWSSTGLLVRPSIPVPRTVFFPVLPSPSSGGLPYGSPLNAIASSSNSAGAPSSSLSSAMPPQTDQSGDIAMVDAGSSTK